MITRYQCHLPKLPGRRSLYKSIKGNVEHWRSYQITKTPIAQTLPYIRLLNFITNIFISLPPFFLFRKENTQQQNSEKAEYN